MHFSQQTFPPSDYLQAGPQQKCNVAKPTSNAVLPTSNATVPTVNKADTSLASAGDETINIESRGSSTSSSEASDVSLQKSADQWSMNEDGGEIHTEMAQASEILYANLLPP